MFKQWKTKEVRDRVFDLLNKAACETDSWGKKEYKFLGAIASTSGNDRVNQLTIDMDSDQTFVLTVVDGDDRSEALTELSALLDGADNYAATEISSVGRSGKNLLSAETNRDGHWKMFVEGI